MTNAGTTTTTATTTTGLDPRITTASPIAPLLAVDGYKHSHRQLYPEGTTRILINWTNRSNAHMPDSTHAVVFGLQAFVQRFLVEAWAPFFAADEELVCDLFQQALEGYFGPNSIGVDHVRALHRLGYLPLEIRALPEGTLAPIGVATLTVENTVDAFSWLPNYIETALSASIWHPSTVATKALEYRDLMEDWAERTGADPASIDFAAHDFSFRGQTSIESAAASGAGHLLSFLGTDSMPTLDHIARYYPGDNGWVAASVPATEHSVMCVRGANGELETFEQILDVYPTGIVSAVSDGFDLFKVLTEVLPQLKDRITARDGKLVIRPDSGDPVDIVTGTVHGVDEAELFAADRSDEQKGVVELLDELFGHTVNERGYKVLDQHIGVIYGDSITLDRARRIYERLAAKGYASDNVVLGIGSYTYQFMTRDNLGSAVKATWALVDGEPVDIQKDPKTGSGKKSAKGRIALHRDATGEIRQTDQATPEDEATSLLQPVWVDGRFTVLQSFADVRETLRRERADRAARRAAAAGTDTAPAAANA
ncbi:nicotinate phosphoribosyltransferase [Curtobacterium sp. MCPF17_047]|uniref:nicotinate phosphoribosyltransferase n=1 Tax=Curtobacterium sp. MCPF17_047 TaxID=2175654 RepID=UPI000DA7DF6F|nr:nicotinate phosphoribosyltransferase [Curtobacterium sp. MCPF17_047]PZF61946.1 nicotinate phosphoribosyltransferase [Curtobacterium sp. MCPF17_047]